MNNSESTWHYANDVPEAAVASEGTEGGQNSFLRNKSVRGQLITNRKTTRLGVKNPKVIMEASLAQQMGEQGYDADVVVNEAAENVATEKASTGLSKNAKIGIGIAVLAIAGYAAWKFFKK